jgi:MoxR-like ATPase
VNRLAQVLSALDRIILGKPAELRLCLACLLARGHLLIEDVPGVGKTTLAHALAQVLGLTWQRVQFTSDLLPADVLGVSVFDRATQRFEFRQGPVFTQLLVADEVNRASPRTQSALLEAMEERQVSIDGIAHPLPEPFFVVATQNPHEQLGTYPLPESQLDRFLMRVALGYPGAVQERTLLVESDRRERLAGLAPALSPPEVIALQERVGRVTVAPALLDYVQALIAHTRTNADLQLGLSPRAGQGLVRAARAWALIQGRDAVLPEDVQAVLPAIASHRLNLRAGLAATGVTARRDLAAELRAAVPVPD